MRAAWTLSAVAMAGLWAGCAAASNTATGRSFTSEWQCDNGRTVLVNAHPVRPREDAWLTYSGQRVEIALQKSGKDEPQRYASKDGKVVWARLNDSSMLQFAGVLDQPLSCTLKSTTQPRK